MKNIFYCSNAHKEIFQHNTRSSFDSYIDIHDLNYLQDDNLEAAIKSITFDNKTVKTVKIEQKYTKPNIVIKQKINNSKPSELLQMFQTNKLADGSYKKGVYIKRYFIPHLSDPTDYVFSNSNFVFLAIAKKKRGRNFSNIQITTKKYVMHNIFLNDVEISSNSNLIQYLNDVLKNVSIYHDEPQIERDLLSTSSDDVTHLNSLEYEIYIESEVGNMLNLENTQVKKCCGKSLRDITTDDWVQNKVFASTHPSHYINTLLDNKQDICYYKIEKHMKSIELNIDLKKNEMLYGIRSNISDPTIRNADYDTIISLFAVDKTNDVVHVDFKNPSFFKTRKELLSRGHFEIIDVDRNSPPNFTFGSPTYIQVVVRKSEMKKPFNIFLDSSCKKSKALYPENNATEFTIELPERLSFNRHWQVTLKSLFLPNKIHNVQKCWFTYSVFKKDEGALKHVSNKKIYLKEGNYPSLDSLINEMFDGIAKHKIPIRIYEFNGKVKIKFISILRNDEVTQLHLNEYLAYILGYTSTADVGQYLRFDEQLLYEAPHEPDLFLIHPKNLIIGCDVVDDTIFGGEHVKLLRMVTNNIHSSSNILSFDFLQNEYVDLNVKEFKSIKIAIMDATGKPVKTDTSFPSRLQLMFSSV